MQATFTKGLNLKTTTIAVFFFLFAFLSTSVSAQSLYYPESFVSTVKSATVKNEKLKQEILTVLKSNHLRSSKGERDTLGCPNAGAQSCYEHRSLGYDGARKLLFGKLHLERNSGSYYVKDVYCQKEIEGGVRPGAIPSATVINCEHTWPQSKFSHLYPKDIQKSDLHHLFPTDSKANSVRGNFDFADVSDDNGNLDKNCSSSKSGYSNTSEGTNLFEPPTEHKGNVARAIFYFSVRYEIAIPKDEEAVLRRWSELDPVDDAEMKRNDEIHYAQGNRNPFIDFSGLAHLINKF